ncbi:MAG: HPr(Ser) kinase/phosphatase [Candidatus Dadabacteria bacterium]|nr:HPr(Ser) kinase/phosphatase [Candidatus Dadabacteria bacterium]
MESVNNLEVAKLARTWGKELQIELIAGLGGLKRKIIINTVRKPGPKLIDPKIKHMPGAIHLLSRTGISDFNKLTDSKKQKILRALFSLDIPCLIAQRGLLPSKNLRDKCEKRKVPLFTTKLPEQKLISLLNKILQYQIIPFTTTHGVLMEILELGVLILGKSGIGKSENALDLINRGSKLISDDVVEIRKSVSGELFGNGPERIKHLMEIRGVGIINIKNLFGRASVMDTKRIDMVIELAQWDLDTEYDRLGIDKNTYNIMGVELPYLLIPVRPGRNTATIIEVAARNQLLKLRGAHSTEKILE